MNNSVKYLQMLKRCRKLDATLLIVVIAISLVLVVSNFILIFSNVNAARLFFDGILIKIVYACAAIYGIYTHKILYAAAAPAIPLLSAVIFRFADEHGALFLPAVIAVAIASVVNNRVFCFLEKQEGYPYFNERFEEQKKSAERFEKQNPFDAESERRKQTAANKMDDLF